MDNTTDFPLAIIMGMERIYVPDDWELPKVMVLDDVDWYVRPISEYMKHQRREDFRVILERFPIGQPHMDVLYLYWFNSTNLHLVDEKVVNNQITTLDVKDVVVCIYHQTKCLDGCNRVWHTFVLDKYFLTEPPDQNIDKAEQLSFLRCPTCHARFRLPVVKIFGEVSTE